MNITYAALYRTRTVMLGDLLHNWSNSEKEGGASLISKFFDTFLTSFTNGTLLSHLHGARNTLILKYSVVTELRIS